MKYTVLGFSQQRLMGLGLGMDEALILRWYIDYRATGRMRTMTIDGTTWVWVNYAGVLSDIPIVGGSAKTISRRFEKLVETGVLEHTTLREGGTFSCYRINEAVYITLVDDVRLTTEIEPAAVSKETETLLFDRGTDLGEGGTELSECRPQLDEGVGQNYTRGSDKNVRPKDSSTRKTLLLDKTHIPKLPPNRPTGRFSKPSIEQIRAYCEQRGNGIDAEGFFDANESTGWVVGKTRKPMVDWQAAIRTWERNRQDSDRDRSPKAITDERRFRSGRIHDVWAGKTTREVEL